MRFIQSLRKISLLHGLKYRRIGPYSAWDFRFNRRWLSNSSVEVDRVCHETGMYHIKWADGTIQRYPFVWMMDNCRCPTCYKETAHARSFLMKDLDLAIAPSSERVDSDEAKLYVTWKNGHIGEYPLDWLLQHKFDKCKYDPISHIKPRTWGPEDVKHICAYHYDEIMSDDAVLFDWLCTLRVVGLTLLRNAPKEQGVLAKIADRVGFLRETHYGPTFHVFTKSDPNNLAYTNLPIGMHSDLPILNFAPGVQFLHCIVQTEAYGGGNIFNDGFTSTETLKRENPDLYDILKTQPISYRDCGVGDYGASECHFQTARTMIEVDAKGVFQQLFISDASRGAIVDAPVDKVQDIYRAMKALHEILNRKETTLEYKMEQGEIAVFNNTRVVHGRTGFEMDEVGDRNSQIRHLEGGYIDWDQIFSKMRVLWEKLNGELRI